MRRERSLAFLLAVVVLYAAFVGVDLIRAAEFSARMIQRDDESADTAKIFVRAGGYRVEQEEEGISIVVIVDSDEGLTYLLLPERKLYMEMESQDVRSMMNDPFQGLKRAESYGEVKRLGSESVGGYECDKFGVSIGGDEVMVKWVSKELEFPLRIATSRGQQRSAEVSEIVEAPVDESLFEIPADYSNQDMSSLLVDTPEWASQVSSEPTMVPPFELNLTEGEMVRIKVEPGKDIDVSGRSLTAGNSAFTVVPFQNGRPVVDPSMGTMNLSEEGQGVRFRRSETIQEADEIVVRVREGEVMISVTVDEMTEQRVMAGEEVKVPVELGKDIKVRLVNLKAGPSKCIWEFSYKGGLLSDDDMGPLEYRTATLRNKNESESQTFQANADEMTVRVEEGEILVKIGQPER